MKLTTNERDSLIVEDVGAVCRALDVHVEGHPDGLVAGQPGETISKSLVLKLTLLHSKQRSPMSSQRLHCGQEVFSGDVIWLGFEA